MKRITKERLTWVGLTRKDAIALMRLLEQWAKVNRPAYYAKNHGTFRVYHKLLDTCAQILGQ